MDDRTYSSLGRHGLASSYSYLDGVPFKIGQGFRQLPQVIGPPELKRNDLSVVNEEYTFETEEAVLAWADAREIAVKKAALEQAEKQRAAEQANKASGGDGVEAASTVEQGDGASGSTTSHNDRATNGNDTNVYNVPNNQPVKPAVPPKSSGSGTQTMSEPGAILKPTPIHTSPKVSKKIEDQTAVNGSSSNSRFDVSMFESEADPFDNLELQTINDMEELKVVLDYTSKSTSASVTTLTQSNQSQTVSTSVKSTSKCESNTESFYDLATVVKDNAWETFSDDPSKDQELEGSAVNAQKDVAMPQVENTDLSNTTADVNKEDEYVEITSEYNEQSVSFQKGAANGSTNSLGEADINSLNAVLGGKLPASLANSKLYKPVLPPINKAGNIANDQPNDSQSQNLTQATNPFLQQNLPDTGNPFLQNTPQPWNPFYQNSALADLPQTAKEPIKPPPVAPKPVPRARQSSARMWSSMGPSLGASLDESSSTSNSIPHNHYSRHRSSSNADLPKNKSNPELNDINHKSSIPLPTSDQPPQRPPPPQPWVKYRPLPPTPSPPPDSYKASHLPASQQIGLTDPYHSLSREAQAFTDKLTNMGFLRARVARAVDKFGEDEKEVLDHLLAVDQLVEKKFPPVIVESALHTFRNDVEQAEKFVKLYVQFEELGFKDEKIRDALIFTDMDNDRTLDILTE